MSYPLNDRHVVARTPHECLLCGYAITPGTRHRVYTMADEDRIYRVREHVPCTTHAEGDEEWYLDEEYIGLVHALAKFDAWNAAPRAATPPAGRDAP